MSEQLVRIGKIVGCHGVRGDVKIRPASDHADWAEPGLKITLKHHKTGEHKHFKIKTARIQGPLVIAGFEDIPDRNAVEPLVGSTLFAHLDDLPNPEAGEFWVDDLIGLTVVDAENGRKRGVVKDLLSSSGTDFLEIQLEDSVETVVIPFIEKFFPTVDLEAKTVSIDLLSDFLSMSQAPVTADRLEQ